MCAAVALTATAGHPSVSPAVTSTTGATRYAFADIRVRCSWGDVRHVIAVQVSRVVVDVIPSRIAALVLVGGCGVRRAPLIERHNSCH